jgi:hypothetical protein
MNRVKGISYRRPLWTIMRFWKDADGLIDDADEVGSFWSQDDAVAETNRLNQGNTDPAVSYDVIQAEASGVYPADEEPPWVRDAERLIRRGYEKGE